MSIAARRMQRSRIGTAGLTAQVAGAVTLGTANYSIPSSNVIYIATNGSDSNAGTLAAPKATLTAALAAITSGGTLVVRAGVYQDTFGEGTQTKSFTLQNYPGETVWFDGSEPITAWTYDSTSGGWWASSTTERDHSDPNSIAGSWNPLAMWRDEMFYDDAPLWQVATTPTTGQFMVDYDNNKVWIYDAPSGHDVRITTRARFLLTTAADTTLRGFGLRGFTRPSWGGCIQFPDAAKRAVCENLHVHDSAPVSLDTDNARIHRCTFVRAITQALTGVLGTSCEWSNNYIDDANWKLQEYSVNSAFKITKHVSSVIKHNIFVNTNRGNAIWLDESCYQPTIVGNRIDSSNQLNAIFIELTEGGIIANNYCYGIGTGWGTTYGLTSFNSGSQQFWNNYVEGYTAYLIHVGGDSRRNTTIQRNSDPPVTYDMIPYIPSNITIANNILGPNAQYFQLGGEPDSIDFDDCMVKIQGNLSYGNQSGGTANSGLMRWFDQPGAVKTIYTTWIALNAAHSGKGLANNALTSTLHPTATEAATLAPSIGVPLPADVAVALGVPAGLIAIGPVLPPPIAI